MKKQLLVISLGLLLIPSLASAQLFMEEGKVVVDVSPLETVSDTMMINNTSDKEVQVKAYWEDFLYQPPYDGSKKFFPVGTTDDSLADWITFSPQEFVLPPFGKKEIAYVIKAPADMAGGHYGVLFVEKQDQDAATRTGVRIITRVGSLFFVNPVDKDVSMSFTNLNTSDGILMGEIKNEGNVILIPKGIYYVMDSQGLVADRGEVAKVYLPPGSSAQVSMALSNDLTPGAYTTVITFESEENGVLVKEVDFEKTSVGTFNLLKIRD